MSITISTLSPVRQLVWMVGFTRSLMNGTLPGSAEAVGVPDTTDVAVLVYGLLLVPPQSSVEMFDQPAGAVFSRA